MRAVVMLHEIGRLSCGCDGWNGCCAANSLCVAYDRCSQSSELDLSRSRAKSGSSPTAMAEQLTMSPKELSMIIKHVMLQTVAKIGPGKDTNSKSGDDNRHSPNWNQNRLSRPAPDRQTRPRRRNLQLRRKQPRKTRMLRRHRQTLRF